MNFKDIAWEAALKVGIKKIIKDIKKQIKAIPLDNEQTEGGIILLVRNNKVVIAPIEINAENKITVKEQPFKPQFFSNILNQLIENAMKQQKQ